jgi:uncharacterized protein (DUF433 family)
MKRINVARDVMDYADLPKVGQSNSFSDTFTMQGVSVTLRDVTASLEGRELPMDYANLITINPNKRSGKPCVRNTRMAVQDVLEYLASGMTPQEIVEEFPNLTLEDVRACLAFAADSEKRTGYGTA